MILGRNPFSNFSLKISASHKRLTWPRHYGIIGESGKQTSEAIVDSLT